MKVSGESIEIEGGRLQVPRNPIIPFIRGDGTGPDIWNASQKVLDAAVFFAYSGHRRVSWREILAGEAAYQATGRWLPEETLEAIAEHRVAIKGPLTTPVGGGIRSLNVALRQRLNLYASVRPLRWVPGTPSPVREPKKVDMIIFRENMEDVYSGLEWPAGSAEARGLIEYLTKNLKATLPADAGIGIKSISEQNTKQLVRMAVRYAVERGKPSVTLVHKGNIMKFTEGAFRDWGYQVAKNEFGDRTVTETEVAAAYEGQAPPGKVTIKDRIADAMFQQVLLRPAEYSVIATPNLNGDYLSDAIAAQVGGLGMAPGANIGDGVALFEATHGSAPRYAGKDMVNPGSVILSGAMMFEHLGWLEAADLIRRGLERTVKDKIVTYDLHRQLKGATKVKCSQFGKAIVENIKQLAQGEKHGG